MYLFVSSIKVKQIVAEQIRLSRTRRNTSDIQHPQPISPQKEKRQRGMNISTDPEFC
uniref:Uncharacterized protein n=1 Tax=Rhizophora mucronata TaxID=61149 RepID=A0A2P2INI5_RHIMU